MRLLPVLVPTDKIDVVVLNSSNNQYTKVSGEVLSKNITYDSAGNITKITVTVLNYDGTTVNIYKEFSYDSAGNLIGISEWKK